MHYSVTPHSLTQEVIGGDPMATLAREDKHTVQPLSGYDVRQSIQVEADDPHAACEAAWLAFQNLDEEHQCPDGKRSLMTGDLAKVVDADGGESWWIVCSIGWSETVAPGDQRQEIKADAG